jgi:hypothetical protein
VALHALPYDGRHTPNGHGAGVAPFLGASPLGDSVRTESVTDDLREAKSRWFHPNVETLYGLPGRGRGFLSHRHPCVVQVDTLSAQPLVEVPRWMVGLQRRSGRCGQSLGMRVERRGGKSADRARPREPGGPVVSAPPRVADERDQVLVHEVLSSTNHLENAGGQPQARGRDLPSPAQPTPVRRLRAPQSSVRHTTPPSSARSTRGVHGSFGSASRAAQRRY